MSTINITNNQKLFLIAIGACNGNVTRACEVCMISRQTYYNWLNTEDSDFAKQISDIQIEAVEKRIDLAESKLDDRLGAGSGPDIRFVLKTLGAKRGYGKQSTITIEPGAGFKDMEWPDEADDLEDWEDKRDKTLEHAKVEAEVRREVEDRSVVADENAIESQ